MNNDKNNTEDKNTVGEVGSSIGGGLDPENNEQVTNNDLKGKKIDADLTEEKDTPADQ